MAVNHLFCELFDSLYGANFMSSKRIVRSSVSSIFAVLLASIFLGLESVFLFRDDVPLLFKLIVLLALNLLIDYISLQETRWVLGLYRKNIELVGLLCLDVVLTGLIFVIMWFILAFSVVPFFFEPETPRYLIDLDAWQEAWGAFFQYAFVPSAGLTFLLSTFFTSFLWMAFAAFAWSLWLVRVSPKVLSAIVQQLCDTGKPVQVVAAVISGFAILSAVGVGAVYYSAASLGALAYGP